MAVITKEIAWGDYNTEGVPGSGIKEPDKAEQRQYLGSLETMAASGAVMVATKAELDAITEKEDNAPGWVVGDSTASNNGIYAWDDGGSTWTKLRGLPDTAAVLTNIAGTANAITADTEAGVDPAEVQILVLPDPPGTNTSTTVTIALNGSSAESIKSASGSNVAIGDIIDGVGTMFFRSGSEWRQLVSSAEGAQFDHQGDYDNGTTYTEGQVVTGSDGSWYQLKAASATGDDPVSGGSGDWFNIFSGVADRSVTTSKTTFLFDAVAEVEAATISGAGTTVKFVETAGYTAANDGGGARYAYVAAEPAHEGKIQSADGAWWTIIPANVGQANILAFGAKDDAVHTGYGVGDGAITASDNTFTSASASFVAGDVGKYISVEGAGAAGVPLVTTIASVTSGTEIELTDAASTTVSGSDFVYGTDNTAAIQSAMDFAGTVVTALSSTGNWDQVTSGVFIPNGSFLVADDITYKNGVRTYGQSQLGAVLFPVGAISLFKGVSGTDYNGVKWEQFAICGDKSTNQFFFEIYGLIRDCRAKDLSVRSGHIHWRIRETWTFEIRDCHSFDPSEHIVEDTPSGVGGEIVVSSSRLDSARSTGIRQQGDENILILINTHIQSSNGAAIDVDNCLGLAIIDGFIENNNVGEASIYHINYAQGTAQDKSSWRVIGTKISTLTARAGSGVANFADGEHGYWAPSYVVNDTATSPVVTTDQWINAALGYMGFGGGTAAAPSVFGNLDRDTGIYFPATGRVGIASAGTLQHQFYDHLESDPVYAQTNAGSANVVVLSNGQVVRSTSVAASKIARDIEHAKRVWALRPVTYRPTPEYLGSGLDRDFIGLISEEVDKVFPELCDYKSWEVDHKTEKDKKGRPVKTRTTKRLTKHVPHGVNYDRVGVAVLSELQRIGFSEDLPDNFITDLIKQIQDLKSEVAEIRKTMN